MLQIREKPLPVRVQGHVLPRDDRVPGMQICLDNGQNLLAHSSSTVTITSPPIDFIIARMITLIVSRLTCLRRLSLSLSLELSSSCFLFSWWEAAPFDLSASDFKDSSTRFALFEDSSSNSINLASADPRNKRGDPIEVQKPWKKVRFFTKEYFLRRKLY